MKHRTLTALALAALLALTSGCSSDDSTPPPTPTESVEITAEATEDALTKEERIAAAENAPAQASPEPAATEPPADEPALDLTTDDGLCAADAELTNLELNDALAPMLGFSADRDLRSFDEDEAIREYKNDAFSRTCPERMS